jgi:GDPmannose 4,6-dehydratase
VDVLQGDAAKAQQCLGWRPTIALEQLVVEMVEADLARRRDARPPNAGG